ncbi:MAG: hypothetical protein WDO69_33125 [Pseudomonadota bacterium]
MFQRSRLSPRCFDPDDSYNFADLLTLAPVEDARKLLVRNWQRLRFVPRFVQAALTIGGAELEPLVAEAIAEWPTRKPDPLKFVVLHLESSFEDGLSIPIDKGRIARLLPYANRLGELGLLRLGKSARKRGLALWGREHIGPLLEDDHRAQVFPTELDVMRQLSDLLHDDRVRRLGLARLGELLEERSDGCYAPLDVLDQWLSENSGEPALEIAEEVIVAIGQRSGIEVLVRHSDLSNEAHRRRLADVEIQVRRASL